MKSKNNFRPLQAWEFQVLTRLLQVDNPFYEKLRQQLPGLRWAMTLDLWGSFVLGASETEHSANPKRLSCLPHLGVVRDIDQVPIQFAVFVDDEDRLGEVEVIRLDGQPLRSQLVPEAIVLQVDQPGAAIG
jgi:hypothetical protein